MELLIEYADAKDIEATVEYGSADFEEKRLPAPLNRSTTVWAPTSRKKKCSMFSNV
ncbi:hypothetical protein [Allobaculum sp. Allo2]|uniref:hypothetical protein n=1 Tax=Allobaculum sp. Allo2 TaxID=2853432 RepID=UPI001F60D94C|nr:hypothetical protein [Allobaculum sp. Allo2]